MLFNAALESALRPWKSRLRQHGVLLTPAQTRLTELRYADDLLLFGKSMEEVVDMFELLAQELTNAGLTINASKTKILTTDENITCSEAPLLVDAAGSMVEVVRRNATHKYLGRLFPGDLKQRGPSNLAHRFTCAWFKYHSLQPTLENKRIPIRLRLKLFDAVISPTVLYSLPTTPLTSSHLEKLDALQRKMMP